MVEIQIPQRLELAKIDALPVLVNEVEGRK